MYIAAQMVINRCGPQAAAHAEQMMRSFLENDDPRGAGVWLTIGQAIEHLTNPKYTGSRH